MGVTLLVNQLLVISIKQHWHSKIGTVFKLLLQYDNWQFGIHSMSIRICTCLPTCILFVVSQLEATF